MRADRGIVKAGALPEFRPGCFWFLITGYLPRMSRRPGTDGARKWSTSPMRQRWLLLILLITAGLSPARAAIPPPRDNAEVRAVLAKAPKAPPVSTLRPLRVLLVANRKDHGYHEHDYPRWMDRWKTLLGGKGAGDAVNIYGPPADLSRGPKPGSPKVTVETAADWPTAEQLDRADLVVSFMGTGGIWTEAKLRDLKTLLDRGAGFVAIHAAVIAEKPHARPLAELLGLAWESGYTLFRHGPMDLKLTTTDHPITRGLPETIRFVDETYWPLVGDASRVNVLATADEPQPGTGKATPQPMFWTHESGKGRVYNTILGHYTWTFDDPYFRLLLLRGLAWAAKESPYRFDHLALVGARTTDRKPAPAVVKTAAPVAPAADDADLLLWLDAADPRTLTLGPDGRVAAWSTKAAGTRARLSSGGAQQPALVAQGLGGRPAVRFDGVDDALRDTAFGQSAREWTLAMVVTPRSNRGPFRAIMAANRPGQDDFQTGFNLDMGGGETGAFSMLNLEGVKAGGATNLRSESAPFGEGQVILLTAGPGRSRLWINGHEEGGRGLSDAVTVMDELRLGARFYLGGERGHFDGEVSEVLLFKTALPEARREGLMAHLMQKYGQSAKPRVVHELDAWDYLPAYDWGTTRRPLVPIDEAVARAKNDSRARRALETRLAAVAADPASTHAARDYACRHLAVVGSSASVPVLEKLVGDNALSHMALFALARIPGPAAEQALIRALSGLAPRLRVGVIQALRERGVDRAVPVLTERLRGSDSAEARAAAEALGEIGTPAAVSALLSALDGAGDDNRLLIGESLLKSAERLQATERSRASALYDRLRTSDIPAPVRVAAAQRVVLLQGAKGVHVLMEMLAGGDPLARSAAAAVIREAPGAEFTEAVLAGMKSLPPDRQALVISALGDRGDTLARSAALEAANSPNEALRLAGLRALGRLGNAGTVISLLGITSAHADAATRKAVQDSLVMLPGREVDQTMAERIAQRSTRERPVLMQALARRGYTAAVPALVQLTRDSEESSRLAAISALGELAAITDAPALVEILQQARTTEEAGAADAALTRLYARIDEKEAWVSALLAGLPAAAPERRILLLRGVSRHGDARALQAVRAAVTDPSTEVQDAAVTMLAEWETPEPADTLLETAKSSGSARHRLLALRGYLRIAGMGSLPAARRLTMVQEGLRLAQRDEERRLALGALAGIGTPEALAAALPYLENEALRDEAAAAVVAIGRSLPAASGATVVEAMDRLLKRVTDPELVRQATELRAKAGGK
jgi:type 1 glutamine amidotransferase/HEAT repeat protein